MSWFPFIYYMVWGMFGVAMLFFPIRDLKWRWLSPAQRVLGLLLIVSVIANLLGILNFKL